MLLRRTAREGIGVNLITSGTVFPTTPSEDQFFMFNAAASSLTDCR